MAPAQLSQGEWLSSVLPVHVGPGCWPDYYVWTINPKVTQVWGPVSPPTSAEDARLPSTSTSLMINAAQ